MDNIKEDINSAVICRINKGTLNSDYNPTAGIWRMKQLGEKDSSTHEINSTGISINLVDGSKP
ncbi:MAG: hypothetical protein IPH88_18370 [Bacteroidales bacterium]|nr:hypothetical protein [Bacteroidales bacterium]